MGLKGKLVMPGHVPGIHVLAASKKDVDGRDEPGHDEKRDAREERAPHHEGSRETEPMITLYHCHAARSFRPLWMLEEMGLDYELKMLPFPPRVFAKEYLAINPLGT